jgi:hypothetical protein
MRLLGVDEHSHQGGARQVARDRRREPVAVHLQELGPDLFVGAPACPRELAKVREVLRLQPERETGVLPRHADALDREVGTRRAAPGRCSRLGTRGGRGVFRYGRRTWGAVLGVAHRPASMFFEITIR